MIQYVKMNENGNKTPKNSKLKCALFLFLFSFLGCEKFVVPDPPSNQINSLNVFNLNATAIAAVSEMYGAFSQLFTGNANVAVSLTVGLTADELSLFSGISNSVLIGHYRNQLASTAAISVGNATWTSLYQRLLAANASLEGLAASTGLSSVVKQQLLGESYFMRAFCYFYLTNLYGDVPLALTTDPNINNDLPRTAQAKVYEQIVSDLQKARELLNPDYVNKDMVPYPANAERVRPNRGAATALLARLYLYMGKSAEAEAAASEVISQAGLYGLLSLHEVFLKNSKEAIWQLQPIRSGRNTDNGFMFLLPDEGPNATVGINGNPVSLSNALVNAFEPDDQRGVLGNWINRKTTTAGITYYYPFKYKVKNESIVTEYEMVLRLAEQYLIRAEARAQQHKLTGANSAASDLNIIRERAGLPLTTATTQTALLDAILQERRVELFTEWGHRWLDIKRTGKVDDVMKVATGEKGGVWESYQQWYPLPFTDIERGPNLKQNTGYN